MEGRGIKCDNCGTVDFIAEIQSDGTLPGLFKRIATQRTMPDGWFIVGTEHFDNDSQDVIQSLRHYCSAPCLAFVANYIYQQANLPTEEKENQ